MIATPTKSDSNKKTDINNIKNKEISQNNDIIEYSLSILAKSDEMKKEKNNSNKNSQIHEAIISDNLEQLANLLKLGENPDIIDKSGETPLYLSVDIENYDAMVILLEFGADCNIQKEDGNTPLHLATEKKNDIYISNLLSHGANPNIINKTDSQTPLHIGIINRINEYILIKFKENNGDIYNIKDKFNKTPFDYSLNDEKYKNLLISIFGKYNCIINNQNDEINEENDNNSNLDYNNFVTLSRKIQLTNEDNEEENKKEETIIYNKPNINENKDLEINNINDVNNCLKKQLLFSSNSKEKSSENQSNKNITSLISSNIGQDNTDKEINSKSRGEIKKNIVNYISDRSSNYSNSLNENIDPNINLNNLKQNPNIEKQEQILYHHLTETNNNNNIVKNLMLSLPYKKSHNSANLNTNYILTTTNNQDKKTSHSLNLLNKKGFYYIINNNLRKKEKSKNSINHINTLYSNTNGNNSLSSCNQKKEGISDINPLEMINQMASSNNSNIFSELQINSNEKGIETKKTEEEMIDNKMTYIDGINTLNENITENFSLNNNNYEDEENKENINFNNNSFDDSLEYSKSKSFHMNETMEQLSLKKNNANLNENEESFKINNKDESFNIYTNFNNININVNNCYNEGKNIERYKSTTSNKSKQDNDNESEQSFGKSSNISNISAFQNKSSKSHYRHLSYHNNNRQSSNSSNNNNIIKSYNSKSLNYTHNNNYYINKENVEPNYTQSEKNKKTLNKSKVNKKLKEPFTFAIKQKIYRSNNQIPEMTKEQKTKDSTMDDYRSNENIILINENSNYNMGTLDNTNQNQYNTYYSDNNSNKNNTKESYKYSNLFKKALKKKFVVKEFSNVNQFDKYTLETENYYSNNINDRNENDNYNEKEIIIHPQQISNDLITKLRDWLISCDLLCYYNILIKNNIYDIDSYITNLKNNKINISYKDIENLGIKKPGHIFRFLLKLQMDIGILDNRICNYIINKFSENPLTTIGMNVSMSEIKYCGLILCPGEDRYTKYTNYYDIFSFLRCKDLVQFKENFIHNGFDQIEFILIQLFSCFAFNKEILNDYMHIYSDKDKKKVIIKLYEEKKNLANLMGIEYNNNEIKEMLDENTDDTEKSEEIKSNNFCNIF